MTATLYQVLDRKDTEWEGKIHLTADQADSHVRTIKSMIESAHTDPYSQPVELDRLPGQEVHIYGTRRRTIRRETRTVRDLERRNGALHGTITLDGRDLHVWVDPDLPWWWMIRK